MHEDDHEPTRPMEHRRCGDIPATKEDVNELQRQLTDVCARMTSTESELRMNTSVTAEIRALLEAARAGMRVLGALGTAAQWAGKIAAAVAAIYTAYHLLRHGGNPK